MNENHHRRCVARLVFIGAWPVKKLGIESNHHRAVLSRSTAELAAPHVRFTHYRVRLLNKRDDEANSLFELVSQACSGLPKLLRRVWRERKKGNNPIKQHAKQSFTCFTFSSTCNHTGRRRREQQRRIRSRKQ